MSAFAVPRLRCRPVRSHGHRPQRCALCLRPGHHGGHRSYCVGERCLLPGDSSTTTRNKEKDRPLVQVLGYSLQLLPNFLPQLLVHVVNNRIASHRSSHLLHSPISRELKPWYSKIKVCEKCRMTLNRDAGSDVLDDEGFAIQCATSNCVNVTGITDWSTVPQIYIYKYCENRRRDRGRRG